MVFVPPRLTTSLSLSGILPGATAEGRLKKRGLGKGTAQPVLLDEEDGLATG
jgi:hypothetical protein